VEFYATTKPNYSAFFSSIPATFMCSIPLRFI
jgi:hypothetical protein